MTAVAIAIELSVGGRSVRVELESDARAIAIVGPSGIGKTTLLRAIAGVVAGARGRIVIDGETLHDDTRGVRVPPHARGLGWVPQDARLFPHLSVRENVAFGARGPIDELCEAVGVAALLGRAPETLSGGERQRVAIARALARRPRALLLDEPLTALDRAARASVAGAIIERCAAEGILRVVVAHDEGDLAALADQRFEMDERGITARPNGPNGS